MKDYTEYEIIDFLLDDSFVKWAKRESDEADTFWSAWMRTYPAKADVFIEAKEIVANLQILPVPNLSEPEVDRIGQAVQEFIKAQEKTSPSKVGFKPGVWIQLAASITLICVIGLAVYFKRNGGVKNVSSNSNLEKIITNKRAVPVLIRLPDHSSVVLKPGGQLHYSIQQFNGEKREVYLSGEAFFEVAKDIHKPFFVYTKDMVTKVLGTSFVVKAYERDSEFKVIVNTGKVSVFSKKHETNKDQLNSEVLNEGAGVLLSANHEAVFNRSASRIIKTKLDKPTSLSEEVTKTSFNFIETQFSDVIAALSNAYDVKIKYNNELSSCPLTASLTNQDLYEKLKLICNAMEAEFTIVQGEIVIKGKGCDRL